MKAVQFSPWLTFALSALVALSACSDDEDPARLPLLDQSVTSIATDALSDSPTAAFVAARAKVVASVAKGDREYAKSFSLSPLRGTALVNDPTVTKARADTAKAVGAKLDPRKVADTTLAQATLDQLVLEIQRRFPGATSCAALGAKADDCVVALLVIEVKRCEEDRPTMLDAGLPMADAATASDATTTSDATIPSDATTSSDATIGSDGSVTPGGDGGTTGPVTAIQCATPRDTTGAREVEGTLMNGDTWSGKVLVRGDLYIRGGTLTIMPGTEVFMAAGTSIDIGYGNAEAAIVAEGTEAAPIRFCGRTQEQGFWDSIVVEPSVTSNSVLRNVLIADAAKAAPALQLKADISIDNVQVRNTTHSGVEAVDFVAGSRRLTVEGSAGFPVALTGVGAITRFPLGGTFAANTENVARVRMTYFDGMVVFHNIGIPYLQEDSVYTRMSDLTFEAGVEYRFEPSGLLNVAYGNANAGFHVNGTAALPVVFRGASDVSANWNGIVINATAQTNSNISYAEIRQAGAASAFALDLKAAIKVEHLTLTNNAKGIAVARAGFAAGSTALSVNGTQDHPLVVQTDGIFRLPSGSTFTGNTPNQIKVEGTYFDQSGTVADFGVPYLFSESFYIQQSMFTIAAGTDIIMSSGTDLHVGYGNATATFVANGTADAPIRFLGSNEVAGHWGSIILYGNVTTSSQLNYVQVGHGGQGTTALIDIQSNVPVTNSRLFSGSGVGIRKRTANPIDYTMTNTFEGVTEPVETQ